MWEKICENTYRLNVVGGWIVRFIAAMRGEGISSNMIFINDTLHIWRLNNEQGNQNEVTPS